MQNKQYRTRQREIIADYLRSHADEHVTVHDIMNYLYSQQLSVGQTTVYRYLDKLVSDGTVRRYPSPDGATCYQYVGSHTECRSHYHLKCTECGQLIHLECEAINSLSAHIADEHGFKVDECMTVFYGRCSQCRKGESV